MLPVVIFPLLHMLNLDVHGKTFSDEVKLVPEAFDQHASVPLDLIKSLIMRVQSLFDPSKAFIKVLNKFLVHDISARRRVGRSVVCVNETRRLWKGEKERAGKKWHRANEPMRDPSLRSG
jgi:hypothetical protein